MRNKRVHVKAGRFLTYKRSECSDSTASNSPRGAIHKRRRKTAEQLNLLEDEYIRNQNWSRKKIGELALRTGLSEGQIYKWSWDQKKKHQSIDELDLTCSEILVPSKLDAEIYGIQIGYKEEAFGGMGQTRNDHWLFSL